ncbi:hypothetical protein FF38_02926 [Lucilia cuprina]|uniref:Uncharacterized protein n=1 Tax=Lucilia cuprina TaxID=7375 RepID=A0A0L0BQJ1_LUCCU|nr:hypothetical protein FF38_02926 [Lucilia cuprina]
MYCNVAVSEAVLADNNVRVAAAAVAALVVVLVDDDDVVDEDEVAVDNSNMASMFAGIVVALVSAIFVGFFNFPTHAAIKLLSLYTIDVVVAVAAAAAVVILDANVVAILSRRRVNACTVESLRYLKIFTNTNGNPSHSSSIFNINIMLNTVFERQKLKK